MIPQAALNATFQSLITWDRIREEKGKAQNKWSICSCSPQEDIGTARTEAPRGLLLLRMHSSAAGMLLSTLLSRNLLCHTRGQKVLRWIFSGADLSPAQERNFRKAQVFEKNYQSSLRIAKCCFPFALQRHVTLRLRIKKKKRSRVPDVVTYMNLRWLWAVVKDGRWKWAGFQAPEKFERLKQFWLPSTSFFTVKPLTEIR